MNTLLQQQADGETNVSTISKNTSPNEPQKRTQCGFFFYHSWLEDISELPLNIQREIIFAVAKYAAERNTPADLSPAASVAFKFCKRIIDYDLERRQETEKRNKKTGKHIPKNETTTSTQTPENHPLQPSANNTETHFRTQTSQNADTHSLPNIPNNDAPHLPTPNPQNADTHSLPNDNASAYYNQESGIENQESEIKPSLLEEKEKASSLFSQLSENTAQPNLISNPRKNTRPNHLQEVIDYWKTENLKSSAQEFFDYYQSTDWKNKQGENLRSWKLAAKNWERYFLTNILPLRKKAEAANLSLQLCEENAATAFQERQRQRQALEADFDEWKRRAVSPEEGRRAYQIALQQTGGDPEAAIELLKRNRDD